ncbi:MAG: amidohydrolase/deacetylase family metallohydrolase [Synergistaceae bacterium]|jgi:dihydroorotase|nr:amidohydrolase/deacetylase family metallohydrolase [Synergistaceae bacterium]
MSVSETCSKNILNTLLHGGRVLDPANGVDGVMDVLLSGGKVAGVGEKLQSPPGTKAIDAEGLLVTPGLVDIHAHLFVTGGNPEAWAGEYSVYPDNFSFRSGVTTLVDAGSAGWRNFDFFRTTVLDRAKTRVFSMLNIAGYGMVGDAAEQYVPDMDPAEAAKTIEKHRDIIVAVKTAHYRGPEWVSVDRALEAGAIAGLPVMVDFGWFVEERPWWRLVTEKLRPGDIATHCFRGPVPIADDNGILYPYLQKARERGVLFDLGHGGGSFLFRNAAPAIRQGFYPDSVSTDLHVLSMNTAMMDMPATLSKCMALGMPLHEAILRSTRRPASMIGHPELGTLSAGSDADVSLWRLRKGRFGFKDTTGGRIEGDERLECEMTILRGEVVWDLNARDAVDYRELPGDAGVRPGEFQGRGPWTHNGGDRGER